MSGQDAPALERNYVAESPEVYYSREALVRAGAADIAFLKERARENPRLRARLCAHPAREDLLHEMLIVHHREAYFRPHRHDGGAQSFVVLENAIAVAILDDDGELIEAFSAAARGAQPFYFRIPGGTWYAFVMRAEWGVFLETAGGPFSARRTVWAPYSPDGSDGPASRQYAAQLQARVDAHLEGR